jgi:hypothetical protein
MEKLQKGNAGQSGRDEADEVTHLEDPFKFEKAVSKRPAQLLAVLMEAASQDPHQQLTTVWSCM